MLIKYRLGSGVFERSQSCALYRKAAEMGNAEAETRLPRPCSMDVAWRVTPLSHGLGWRKQRARATLGASATWA